MSSLVAIRRLHVADVEDFRAIRLAALATEPGAFGSVHAIEASRARSAFKERLATSVVLGAYDGPRIVGMAGLRQEDGPKDRHKGRVWGFYVERAARRRGIGSALLAALLDVARDRVEQVLLAVVEDNPAAIALYRRFGFEVYGVEPRALKTATGYANELLMALLLRP